MDVEIFKNEEAAGHNLSVVDVVFSYFCHNPSIGKVVSRRCLSGCLVERSGISVTAPPFFDVW